MRPRKDSLQQEARAIFGDDQESIRRWVEYWQHSKGRNRALLSSFERLVLLAFSGKTVLDIGCGTGGLGELIGDRCKLYVGADYNLHVLKFADPALRRKYLQCSGVSLPFRAASFDYIFAFDVIEHIQGGEKLHLEFLRELRRVLRPCGMIFFTTPNFWCPFEGHSRMYFPQYLPRFLADRYIGMVNPGFLREHNTFGEIQLLSPRQLRRHLRRAALTFLHDLPCALDRAEFLRHAPLPGLLAYLGLGWYPHAEFWGILVREEAKPYARRKLRRSWFYEQNQPSSEISDFQPLIDFEKDAWGYQLGRGWHWHERNGRGYRWAARASSCFLEHPPGPARRYLKVRGYSPVSNRLEVSARLKPREPVVIGEHFCKEKAEFEVQYLLPAQVKAGAMLQIDLCFDRTFQAEDPNDSRELGAMIFQVGLVF